MLGEITFGEEGWGVKKEDGRLIIVFRRLLRTSESNTELYRKIHNNIYIYYSGLHKGHAVDLM